MADPDLRAYLADLAARLGTPVPGDDELAVVLDVTRAVAHGAERRFGPAAVYVLGLAAGAAGDGDAERRDRLAAALAAIEEEG